MKVSEELTSSRALAAICLSIDDFTSTSTTSAYHADKQSSSSTGHLGASPAIDRHNPMILSDSRRNPKTPLPIISKSQPQLELKSPEKPPVKQVSNAHHHQRKKGGNDQKGKRKNVGKSVEITTRSSCATMSSSQQNLFTPPGSTRYLLSENMSFGWFQDPDPVLLLVETESEKTSAPDTTEDKLASPSLSSVKDDDLMFRTLDKPSLSSSHQKSHPDQVVVLKVSLHCKGCAAKVRKHISRMEGVTSFNIDFAAKKVTVVGDVTPLGVLATISKVKNAQIWTPEAPKASLFPS